MHCRAYKVPGKKVRRADELLVRDDEGVVQSDKLTDVLSRLNSTESLENPSKSGLYDILIWLDTDETMCLKNVDVKQMSVFLVD